MSAPLGDQPVVLPLDREAEVTVRHVRGIAWRLNVHADPLVVSEAQVLNDLADALERSLNRPDGTTP